MDSDKEAKKEEVEETKADDEKKEEKKEEVKAEDTKEEQESKEKATLGQYLTAIFEEIKALRSENKSIKEKLKAMEVPTDLPLKPATSDSEDVGAKVTVPDKYMSNSIQASVDPRSNEKKPESDKPDLKMQEKAQVVAEAPRPPVMKADNAISHVLSDCRKAGWNSLSEVERLIRKGHYLTQEEVMQTW